MRFIFQHSLFCDPHTSPISVAVLESHWYKKLSTANMSSNEPFSPPSNICIHTYIHIYIYTHTQIHKLKSIHSLILFYFKFHETIFPFATWNWITVIVLWVIIVIFILLCSWEYEHCFYYNKHFAFLILYIIQYRYLQLVKKKILQMLIKIMEKKVSGMKRKELQYFPV